MQTVTKRLFLTGIFVVAFHILSLNARIPSLIFLSVNILIFFVIIALITLIGRVTTRYYNRLHLKGMRNQIAEVAKILENTNQNACLPAHYTKCHPKERTG
ncbi:MAG TPA: hypothetical protein VJ579_01945 [Candidatus Paceibacterota bacterium]|nr:hypothetical protein [Candidatus Paceibacterota bacterium]